MTKLDLLKNFCNLQYYETPSNFNSILLFKILITKNYFKESLPKLAEVILKQKENQFLDFVLSFRPTGKQQRFKTFRWKQYVLRFRPREKQQRLKTFRWKQCLPQTRVIHRFKSRWVWDPLIIFTFFHCMWLLVRTPGSKWT